MLKKTIKYTDYNGVERVEDHYFNLNQFELTEFAAELPDGLFEAVNEGSDRTQQQTAICIHDKLGGKGIIEFIKKLVIKSYGVKSSDGKRFIKNQKLCDEFVQSIAFDTFMMELMSDDMAAANFVNAIIPANLAAKLAEKEKAIGVVTE